MKKLNLTTELDFEDAVKKQADARPGQEAAARAAHGGEGDPAQGRVPRLGHEQEVDRYLQENRRSSNGPHYHARHILVVPEASGPTRSGDGARDRRGRLRRLKAGADFVEVAKEVSRTHRQDGGDWGRSRRRVGRRDRVADPELGAGTDLEPFRTGLGYHIVKLESGRHSRARADAAPPAGPDVLFREKYQAPRRLAREIKKRAIIEVRI